MAKYKVEKTFKDGQTGKFHFKGEEIDITEARAKKFPEGTISKATSTKQTK